MFQPFENASQFYPGLILWCDPNSYDMEATTLPPNTTYDRKKMRELRPCLVVAILHFRVPEDVLLITASQPTDPRRWVRVDTPPPVTWKLPDAWLWIGTPATVKMIFNNSKAMHRVSNPFHFSHVDKEPLKSAHKDAYYNAPPVAAANVQNYWIHRQNYLNQNPSASTSRGGGAGTYNTSMHSTAQYYSLPGSTIYSSNPSTQGTSTQGNNTFSQASNTPAMFDNPGAYLPSGYYGYNSNMNAQAPQQGFNTLASQPVVVPAGFTETHPSRPGWWRNPETGWFWHAAQGLLPPGAMRGPGARSE
ncbi:hypothetical protein MVEN_02232700 [Mycena venus]|uniref:Uncharacterized protein n=1 Tax=Mycena venus TaxID=2733690 RepID=A0A8H7CFI2_9AGAR|nr:hypothetical protein MVEN_02232700 [Mycena venus]